MNTQASATPVSEKLSVIEKIGYSLGDLAANLIFQTLVTFITFFYTDVFGISADSASNVTFIAGMISALIFTPVMGLIADRTKTRWGRFRPWILWTAVPFGVLALLAFSTPVLSPHQKIIYAFVTYLLLLAVYAANNLPYAALSGVLTGNMAERNSISSYRFVAVMVAQFIIQVLLLPLVLIMGHGNKTLGFHNAMLFFAITGVIFFLITFLTTKERIQPISDKSASPLQDIKDLFNNKPWIIILLATILVFVTLALKGGFYIYYFKDYLDAAALGNFLNGIGFNTFINGLNSTLHAIGLTSFEWPNDAATSAFGLFNGCGIIMMIIGIGFSKKLADRFGKRNTFGVALFISTLFVLIFNFFPKNAIGLCFISQILHGFSYGITIPLLWAMIADVADYSEWINSRRATGIIFSAMLMGLKAGLTIGSALVGKILALYGYSAALTAQAPATVAGIKAGVSVYASIPFFAACALMLFYSINKPMETKIEAELNERRKAAGK